ncbi:MAG: primosomal protein N' [Planctomycetota bacterium]
MPPTLFSDPVSERVGYASVVPERSLDAPDGLTYAIPRALDGLRVGERVTVPLGRGDRRTAGVVIEVKPEPPHGVPSDRIKSVVDRTGVALPASLVELARWTASYYCCPLGMTIASMLPAAVKSRVGQARRVVLERTGAEPVGQLPPATASAWDAVQQLPGTRFPAEAKPLAAALGLRSVAPLNRLVKSGLLRERVVDVVRTRTDAQMTGSEVDPRPTPTPDQSQAIETITAALGTARSFLVFGVTGSGKTEVYLTVIERAIARGACAIVLVPEIALTPQTVSRFAARFPPSADGSSPLAVLHSGITASHRHDAWRRVAAGEARIVVGARSAIFAPFSADARLPAPLGVIVVDEEHDGSYKQDQAPRYHARDVALKRAALERCPVVLGSATPSLESWRHAIEPGGRHTLIELPARVAGGRMPPIRIVDRVAEERQARQAGSARPGEIGPTLDAALAETLSAGEQAILLLNRRGYASHIHCARGCGYRARCAHCDVALVLHRGRSGPGGVPPVMRCHHCLAETRPPSVCPDCGGALVRLSAGTQQVEDQLAERFPALEPGRTLLRLDADTMRRAPDYFAALERFRRGEARVLLGTQMLAKGLDFPDVTLIGVINADTALHVPDFRAGERTFQLIAQVAGRAGRSARSAERSRVIVQSFDPSHPALLAAARLDARGFAEAELESRTRFRLPPCGRLARVVFRDPHPTQAEDAANGLAAALASCEPIAGLHVRGPMPCPVSRIADHFRVEVQLSSATPGPIQTALARLREQGHLKLGARCTVDVDPITLA